MHGIILEALSCVALGDVCFKCQYHTILIIIAL